MKEDLINWLNSYQFHGIKPGLKRIRKLLKLLGNPHKKFKTIHIAGTNGKGSTSAILSTILSEHGLKTGLYTSPHLFHLNERFKVNQKDISEEELTYCLEVIKKIVGDQEVTYFEITTALAFFYFAEKEVDIAVIECGLGGRLDATNVVLPEACIITNIGFDHTKYLGNTLESIAKEKAGIIKKEKPCVLGNIKKEIFYIFENKAKRVKSDLYLFERDFFVDTKGKNWIYKGEKVIENLELSLKGSFQGVNLGCAIKVCEILEKKGIFRLSEKKLKTALKKVVWKGRYQRFVVKDKEVLLDVAHNIEGLKALKKSLLKDNFKEFLLILGVSNEDGKKDYKGMLKEILPLAKKIFICEFPCPRRIVSIAEWKSALKDGVGLKIKFFKNYRTALEDALLSREKRILVTGSIYFIAEVLKYWEGEKVPK
jgi:dihydrofolate synthase/folylpolyglutamate synthase